jgi:four helix bundle protein
MGSIKRFEDLKAWQAARAVTKEIYRLTKIGAFAHDFRLRDQIRDSSASIMANIAEGFGRGGDNEFRQFLANAHGSATETQSHCYVALDAEYLSPDEFTALYASLAEVQRLITGLIHYLNRSPMKGSKYASTLDNDD